jgi:integrase
MPRRTTGSPYHTKTKGEGIRWPEDGRRRHQAGFKTKTEARRWFAENVAPRLDRGAPSPEITFKRFCDIYIERWGADVADSTRGTLEEWLAPARETFGSWTLRELEGGANDISRWRLKLAEGPRYRATRGLRQALAAAVRWRYMSSNPAVAAGANPTPRAVEIDPFAAEEIEAICAELGTADRALVVFASETGLRTNEWTATERRDIDRDGPAVMVRRRYARGRATPYPKTERRRVPLTARAFEALQSLPPRLDTPLVFPAAEGGPIELNNWRRRVWHPALEAAGLRQRGPYHLRHTFATRALDAGMSIFRLAGVMGASVRTIEHHYAAHTRESEDEVRALLEASSGRSGDVVASGEEE